MSSEERSQPHQVTIPELWEMYQQRDKPLNEATIRAILDSLAGTSFFKRLIDGFASIWPVRPVQAHDVYGAFYWRVLDTPPDTWRDHQQYDEAARCCFQLSGCSVPYEQVYAIGYLEADELLLRENRRDWLYHDYDHTQFAGSHRASQFWMYKGGSLRGVLSFSMVDYEAPPHSRNFFHHAILAEGALDHAFFADEARRPLLALDPRQSLFLASLPLVYISPQFSFEQARPQETA